VRLYKSTAKSGGEAYYDVEDRGKGGRTAMI